MPASVVPARTGKAVIVTRPEIDADRVVEMIEAAGHMAIRSPLMQIVPNAAKADLGGVGALAFTSANGVRAFAGKSGERHLPVFAVGRATAKTACQAGFGRIHVADGDVDALAALIAQTLRTKALDGRVLHLAGTERAGDLVAALRAQDIPAGRQVIYDAQPVRGLSPAALAAIDRAAPGRPAPIVALFSPRTARLFLDALEAAGRAGRAAYLSAACLSEAVADAVGADRWRDVRIAREPTAEALVDTLSDPEPVDRG